MTKEKFFSSCSGPLEAAYGPMHAASVQMYFRLLSDLDPDLLSAAVAKCITELKWLPKIAEIRQAAVDILSGEVQEMTPSEAWGQAYQAIRRIDFGIDGSIARAKERVAPLVWEAMQNVGLTTLVNDRGSLAQKWFHEAYAALAARERKLKLAAPQVWREIQAHREIMSLPIPSQIHEIAGQIGALPQDSCTNGPGHPALF